MASFKSPNYWTSMANRLKQTATFTTSTIPKQKSYAAAASNFTGESKPKAVKGDFVPVCVAVGMIALSVSLGLHTAMQHLKRSPSVYVKKQRRETLPEVVEPDRVAEEAEEFVNKSFFRKIAHVQDYNKSYGQVMDDPTRRDIYAHPPRVESLKSVGVDPLPH